MGPLVLHACLFDDHWGFQYYGIRAVSRYVLGSHLRHSLMVRVGRQCLRACLPWATYVNLDFVHHLG